MEDKAMIPLILLTFHNAFFVGAAVADPEHIIKIIGWESVLLAFTVPAVLGYLVGMGTHLRE